MSLQAELFSGNPLLASWGKMGRDFLYQLVRDEENIQAISRDYYADLEKEVAPKTLCCFWRFFRRIAGSTLIYF